MKIYRVTQYANRPMAGMDGYCQFFKAENEDLNETETVFNPLPDGATFDYVVLVQDRPVKASGTYAAIRKFEKWLNNGESSSWLLSDADA